MPSDCLVLKLQELEVYNENNVDNEVYILYDMRTDKYIVRGKRGDTDNTHYADYSFDCYESADVLDFLKFALDNSNLLNYTLYNFKNLPFSSKNIDYSYLSKISCESRQVACYEEVKFTAKYLRKKIQLLKNVCNNY